MTMLTADELSVMRTEAERILVSTCSLLNSSTTRDDLGGGTVTWGTASSIPCRLSMVQSTSPQTASMAGQFQVHAPFVLSLEWDRTVLAGYRAIVNSDTYEVLSVADDHDDRVLRRAYLRRVDK